jgi:hypothetical protein
VGETLVDVPVTVPIPLIESEVAPETDQDNCDDWPLVIAAGAAVNDEIVGGGGGGAPLNLNVAIIAPIS